MDFVVCTSTVYTFFIVFSVLWKIFFFLALAYSKDVKASIIGLAVFEISWLGALYFLLKLFNGGCIL